MASKPLKSPKLELHESEIAKPQPLRIIKRSKTISGSSATGEAIYRGRRGSFSSDQSKGSPPMAADRPLTVQKVRNGRGSILNGSSEEVRDVDTENSILDMLNRHSDLHDDPDTTPKARKPVPRTVSAGAFLKEEYHGGNSGRDAGGQSVRIHRCGINLPDLNFLDQAHDPMPFNDTSPKIPERRFSKSKNFLLRAIGGRNAESPRAIRRSDSTMSKNTLIRRLSRGRNRSSGSHNSSYEYSIMSTDTSCSFEPASADIADVSIKSRMSSFNDQPLSSSVSETTTPPVTHNSTLPPPAQQVFVLCPRIKVTPEVASVDGGMCTLWVAVEVSGVLRKAEGEGKRSHEVRRFPSQSINAQLLDLRLYGKLHSMRIELHPGQGCKVLEIIGNLHESKTVRASETHLILAKMRLDKIELSPEGDENSSDELIADLQNHLGETISSYLTVRLVYKHSAFQNEKTSTPDSDAMKMHTSRIETEATATIKRRNPESAWSPRTSQTINVPLKANPLLKLIENHFLPDKARDASRKLADDRSSITFQRYTVGGSSEETVKGTPKTGSLAARIDSAISLSLLDINPVDQERLSRRPPISTQTVGRFGRLPHEIDGQNQQFEDIDPARKIWTEMRLTSRGGRHRIGRTSISADHYFSLEDETSPTRASSGDNSVSTNSSSKTEGYQAGKVDHERNRIMEVALRNKRSVGTETLRSIAPSITRSAAKPKGGTVSGLGLRTWGWGPPWW